jgi:hypothetical protein
MTKDRVYGFRIRSGMGEKEKASSLTGIQSAYSVIVILEESCIFSSQVPKDLVGWR